MRRQGGFTLLEMLAAIAIFAFVSMAAYQVLQNVLESDQRSQVHSERLRQVQRAFTFMQRDFSHAVARGVRDDNEEKRPLINAGKFILESDDMAIELVANSWRNPQASLPRSQLQRLAYRLKDNKLEKLFFPYPDAIVGQEPRTLELLDKVEALSFRFFGSSGWSESISDDNQMPRAIELKITLEDWGELRRVFLVAEGVRGVVLSQSQDDQTSGGSSNGSDNNSGSGGNSGSGSGNNSGSQPPPENN